jgi:hypothetical protein
VTVVCPSGHASATTDYCDQCGAPIAPPAATVMAPPPGQATEVLPVIEEEADTSPAARREPCPACGAPRSGDDRYCEDCGHDFTAPRGAGTQWEAIATVDRRQFERQATEGLSLPAEGAERRFLLNAPQMRIGRRRERPGEPVPEIDLGGPPEDPGISRMHAVLERQDDGTYRVRDLGSTNGTTLNDDPRPIATDHPVALAHGDRIRLGAWTTITLQSR